MTASTRLRAVASSAEHLLSDADNHEIQVSGLTLFPMNRWREGILHYLFGVWGNKDNVMYRPKINFGGVSLRLDVAKRKYYAYGIGPDAELLAFTGREIITLDDQSEVEVALIRFVKNDEIKRLTIVFPNRSWFYLWKTERRGEYRCAAVGIPTDVISAG